MLRKSRPRLVLGALVLVIATLFWWRHHADARQLAEVKEMQKELFAARVQLSSEDRRQKWQDFRGAMDKLSPEQRQRLWAEQTARFDNQMLRYAAAPKQERTRILDDDIRRIEERRQRRQERANNGDLGGRGNRAGGGANAGANGGGPPGGTGPGPPNGSNGPRSNEQRLEGMKRGLDNSTPEVRAARDLYRQEMQARRTQLGLPPLNDRGGFGGGFGGGGGRR